MARVLRHLNSSTSVWSDSSHLLDTQVSQFCSRYGQFRLKIALTQELPGDEVPLNNRCGPFRLKLAPWNVTCIRVARSTT